MTPSNANTSGLEVVAWEARLKPDGKWLSILPKYVEARQKDDAIEVRPYSVTAASAQARIADLKAACFKQDDAICQTLGAALGYPRYVDDQVNFPGSTESDGVCVGEHVAETIAEEAALRIAAAEARADRLAKALTEIAENSAAAGWSRDLARAALQQEG